MFEMLTDGQDAGVTGILLAHPWAFCSGELNIGRKWRETRFVVQNFSKLFFIN